MGHIFVLRKVDVQFLEMKCKETEKICLIYSLDDDLCVGMVHLCQRAAAGVW
jgi:hypothetical protein